jgi:hypothetical protein
MKSSPEYSTPYQILPTLKRPWNKAGRGLGADPVFAKQHSNWHPDVINLQVLSNEISPD